MRDATSSSRTNWLWAELMQRSFGFDVLAMIETGQHTLAWARVRQGLTKVEAVGTLAFYLIDMATRMYRPQLRMQFVEPYPSDLGVLAECLEAGETFANAFVEEAIEAGV
jgi:hypothetical protein